MCRHILENMFLLNTQLNSMDKISLIYLARGKDTSWESFERFFSSYRSQPASLEHDLVVAIKGWDNGERLTRFKTLCSDIVSMFLELPDDGYDWGAYFRTAEALNCETLCFLNTHSEILHPNWLRILQDGLLLPETGAVGCTGSWESMLPSLNHMLGYFLLGSYTFRDLLHWCANHRHFPRYPNPHLRSNAFIIPRSIMLAFAKQRAIPKSKAEAYRLESGYVGLTNFLVKQGIPPRLAGADGNYYSMPEWNMSRTFRQADSENLLVADNQTRDFASRPPEEKAIFMASSWDRKRSQRLKIGPLCKTWAKQSLRRIATLFC
jgi:hypothetical protein